MARIRTIKPELWTDPEFIECSLSARLLFVSALNFASDYGVLADKPKQLKMQCLPADDVDINALISELVDNGFWVRRVAPDGANVLVIRTFKQHQRVNRPTAGRWGDPAEWGAFPPPPPGALSDPSVSTHPRKGREGKGREGKGSPPTDVDGYKGAPVDNSGPVDSDDDRDIANVITAFADRRKLA